MAASRPILMGIVGAPHGVSGDVRVKTFAQNPQDLGAYGPLFDSTGRQFAVSSLRVDRNGAVVRFAGVRDRDAAAALGGTRLFIDRDALPPAEDDAFYHADLVGLSVLDPQGGLHGRIRGVHNFGADDLLEIEGTDGKTAFIPFTRTAVPEVDIGAGRVTVEPVAAGLAPAEAEPDEPGQ